MARPPARFYELTESTRAWFLDMLWSWRVRYLRGEVDPDAAFLIDSERLRDPDLETRYGYGDDERSYAERRRSLVRVLNDLEREGRTDFEQLRAAFEQAYVAISAEEIRQRASEQDARDRQRRRAALDALRAQYPANAPEVPLLNDLDLMARFESAVILNPRLSWPDWWRRALLVPRAPGRPRTPTWKATLTRQMRTSGVTSPIDREALLRALCLD